MSEADLDHALRATGHLDDLRRDEFSRLDDGGHVYLDHTGSALYPRSLVDSHLDLLRDGVFGNPHSDTPNDVMSYQRDGTVTPFFERAELTRIRRRARRFRATLEIGL